MYWHTKRSSSSTRSLPTGISGDVPRDESCDFAVVKALRNAGFDVAVVAERQAGAEDERALALAHAEDRVLVTEDKDFGVLAHARRRDTAGVILVRFPAAARSMLGQSVVGAVVEFGSRPGGAFLVVEPGRARLSRPRER